MYCIDALVALHLSMYCVDALVVLDLSVRCVDALVVFDLSRCTASMHLLHLTSLDVLRRCACCTWPLLIVYKFLWCQSRWPCWWWVVCLVMWALVSQAQTRNRWPNWGRRSRTQGLPVVDDSENRSADELVVDDLWSQTGCAWRRCTEPTWCRSLVKLDVDVLNLCDVNFWGRFQCLMLSQRWSWWWSCRQSPPSMWHCCEHRSRQDVVVIMSEIWSLFAKPLLKLISKQLLCCWWPRCACTFYVVVIDVDATIPVNFVDVASWKLMIKKPVVDDADSRPFSAHRWLLLGLLLLLASEVWDCCCMLQLGLSTKMMSKTNQVLLSTWLTKMTLTMTLSIQPCWVSLTGTVDVDCSTGKLCCCVSHLCCALSCCCDLLR